MNFTTTEQLVLASASPRRKELLSMLGVPFTIVTSDVEETSVQAMTAAEYVEGVALLKTRDVAKKCPEQCIIVPIQSLFLKTKFYISLLHMKKQ